MKNNPLVKRVIAVLDRNKDGTISFLEFVQGLNSLSAGASQEDKLRFAFQIYDINNDGFISNGELFQVLKMMVGDNLNDVQLQQLVDRTIVKADTDFDGKISFDEFCVVSAFTACPRSTAPFLHRVAPIELSQRARKLKSSLERHGVLRQLVRALGSPSKRSSKRIAACPEGRDAQRARKGQLRGR